jgi:flavin reductase (DIM6/NTAB) family NADH-FMN oxidoreductase RutF
MSSAGIKLTRLDPALYRRTCALFATGITVITTIEGSGHPHGMTVNSFSSVSLDPPLILVCIDLKNAILGHFLTSAWFAVNILAEDQEDVSRRFSSAAEKRFEGMEWSPGGSGVPLIPGALAHLECELTKTFEAGDHAVLIGEVRQASFREGNPLVYFGSSYRALTPAGR